MPQNWEQYNQFVPDWQSFLNPIKGNTGLPYASTQMYQKMFADRFGQMGGWQKALKGAEGYMGGLAQRLGRNLGMGPQQGTNLNNFAQEMFNQWRQSGGQFSPQYQQQAHQNELVGGRQLGTISDRLNAPPPVAPLPTQPGLSGTAPIGQPNYVSSDRLNQGKGWSKFRNQTMGTSDFDMINKIINQRFR